jgi:hypothetical protein
MDQYFKSVEVQKKIHWGLVILLCFLTFFAGYITRQQNEKTIKYHAYHSVYNIDALRAKFVQMGNGKWYFVVKTFPDGTFAWTDENSNFGTGQIWNVINVSDIPPGQN